MEKKEMFADTIIQFCKKKLHWIDKPGRGGSEEVEKLKQHIQFQEKQLQEQRMQSEERERELREQLQQKLSQHQEQKPDVRDVLIKQLEAKVKAYELAQKSPKEALSEYFKAKSQEQEAKRKPGRPRIEGKRFDMRLDLDIAIVLEEVAKSQKRSLARLINETMRNYLYDSYSELLDKAQE